MTPHTFPIRIQWCHLFGMMMLCSAFMFSGCPAEPCCEVDSDCSTDLICVASQCTYECRNNLDCKGQEICLVQEHLGKKIAACTVPGEEEGVCPARTPPEPVRPSQDGGTSPDRCEDDLLEENDEASEATVAESRFLDLQICADDSDWFSVNLTAVGSIAAEIRFLHAEGDLDLQLVDASGEVVGQSTTVSNIETVTGRALDEGSYFIHVYGYAGSQNQYDLEIDVSIDSADGGIAPDAGTVCTDQYEPNDSPDLATAFWAPPVEAQICEDNDDYFLVYPVNTGSEFLFEGSVQFENSEGDLDISLLSPEFDVVQLSQGASNEESISYTTASSDAHILRIYGFNGATNQYTIAGFSNVAPELNCGNNQIDDGEECDDGNLLPNDGCSPTCQYEIPNEWTCNPERYFDEACDCGCLVPDPSCASSQIDVCDNSFCPQDTFVVPEENHLCFAITCGNGTVDEDEECDDGNNTSGDGCDASCALEPLCGNGAIEGDEACDDGNTTSGDGCDANCQVEISNAWSCEIALLGDGPCDCGCSILDTDCETANIDSCLIFHCGDGITVEEDANYLCLLPGCGNDNQEEGEECDDGNDQSGDGCDQNCRIESTCGDTELEGAEECDDGNLVSGDGCSELCAIEVPTQWSCPDAYYSSDDGCDCGCGIIDGDCESASSDVCEFNQCPMNRAIVEDNNALCEYNSCGNGQLNPTEQCDDGNNVSGDGCSHVCREEAVCGDNDRDGDEECDDGNLVSGDGCTSNCRLEFPPQWTCDEDWFLDGFCDCGCGAFDPDCPSESSEVCDFQECDGSFVDPEQNWLCIESQCIDDEFEENDSAQNPIDFGSPGSANLVLCPNDRDYFAITLQNTRTYRIQIEYDPAPGVMELAIGQASTGVLQESTSGTGQEEIIMEAGDFDIPSNVEYILRIRDGSEGPGPGREYVLTILD